MRTRLLGSAALLAVGCVAAALGPVSPARADTAVQIQVTAPAFAGVPIDGSYGALDLHLNTGLAIGPWAAVELDRISLTFAPPQPGSPYNTPIEAEVEGPGGWTPVFNGLAGTVTAPLVDPGTGQPPQVADSSTATIHLRVRLSTPLGRCTVTEKLDIGFPQAQMLNSGTPSGSAQVTVTHGLLIGSTDYNLSSPPPCAAPLMPSGGTSTQAPAATTSSSRPAAPSSSYTAPAASTATAPASAPTAPASSPPGTTATSSTSATATASSSPGSGTPTQTPTDTASPQSTGASPSMAPVAATSPGRGWTSPLLWILAVVATTVAAGSGGVLVLRRRRPKPGA